MSTQNQQQISIAKLKLQRIIANIKQLEQLNSNKNIENIQHVKQELESDFTELENMSIKRIHSTLKRRQLKRKNAKQRSKNSTTMLMLNSPVKANSDSATITSAPPLDTANVQQLPIKAHHNLRNHRSAQRYLRTFELLKILHYARSQNIEETREFALKFTHLSTMWHAMLQQNKPQRTQQAKLEDQWNMALFGPKEQRYYESQKQSLNNFLTIRHTWDSYLSTDSSHGSHIPIGWVVPKPYAAERWSSFQKH